MFHKRRFFSEYAALWQRVSHNQLLISIKDFSYLTRFLFFFRDHGNVTQARLYAHMYACIINSAISALSRSIKSTRTPLFSLLCPRSPRNSGCTKLISIQVNNFQAGRYLPGMRRVHVKEERVCT